ncbi:MAG: ATP-dependent Clp protease adaptor ClpS [Sulfurimonas sp.]|nr:ATP-dependent Clp protease adaptor ClpS [Sulfurimonas sp.]MDQ7062444.1 ATP-dependent Clp protease adaptor ClpS [Sulfurimonas sp.]
MPIKIRTSFYGLSDRPKMYFVYIRYNKYISWEFCMRVLIEVFHKNKEDAKMITEEILSNGEGICGAYLFEVAETKANIVEELAKKEEFSMSCLIEEI